MRTRSLNENNTLSIKTLALLCSTILLLLLFSLKSNSQETKTKYDYHFFDNFDYSDFPLKRDSFNHDYERVIFTGEWIDSKEEEVYKLYMEQMGLDMYKDLQSKGVHAKHELSPPPHFASALKYLEQNKHITDSERDSLSKWYIDKTLAIDINDPYTIKYPALSFITEYRTNIYYYIRCNPFNKDLFLSLVNTIKSSYCIELYKSHHQINCDDLYDYSPYKALCYETHITGRVLLYLLDIISDEYLDKTTHLKLQSLYHKIIRDPTIIELGSYHFNKKLSLKRGKKFNQHFINITQPYLELLEEEVLKTLLKSK